MKNTILTTQVMGYFDRLRLVKVKDILSQTMELAETQSISYLSFLEKLLAAEVAHKDQRRIEMSLRVSGLPYIRSIDDFDFNHVPTLDQRLIHSLFDLTFIAEKKNILFLGPPGLGKTHLAIALAVKACHSGFSIYFTEMDSLIKKLKDADTDTEKQRTARSRCYNKSSLVIIDEVGYTPLDRYECNLFFRFIKNRYEKNSIILTSNKSFSQWAELAADPIIMTAILDRLLHHSITVNLQGDSFRLKYQNKGLA